MTTFRLLALTLAIGLLVGCDEQPKPPAPVPAPTRTEPVLPAEAAPPAPTEPAQAMRATAPPTPPARPDSEPAQAARAAPPDKAPAAARSQPRPAAKTQSRPELLPPVKLDLRLPPELVQHLEPGEALDKLPEQEPLLPPLFVEKPAEPGPYQLNGRLITNERVDDYWDSVEGAELQIEFRN